MKKLAGATVVGALLALCGCEVGAGDGKVAGSIGTVLDEKSLTIGGEEQTVRLGRGLQSVELTFPAMAVPGRVRVVVRVETNVMKRGAMPVNDTTVQIATQDLVLAVPARMRTAVPDPPEGASYSAYSAREDSESWSQRDGARAVPGTSTAGTTTWEMEIGGSGLWAMSLSERRSTSSPDAGTMLDATGSADRGSSVDVATPADAAVVPRIDAGPAGADAGDGLAPAVDATSDRAVADAAAAADAGPGDAASADAAPADAAGPPPIPQLTGIAPAMGPVATAVQLTLTGSDFADPVQVYFDGKKVPTMRQSGSSLRADVDATMVAQAGQYGVQVESGGSGLTSRSTTLYFIVTAPVGGPELVDYSPDNGVAGEKIKLVGRNLAALVGMLTIADPTGTTAAPGLVGTVSWWTGTMDTVEFTVPVGWQTGPITVANPKGTYRGKIFNVGRNLANAVGTVASASSEYGGTWTIARGADNLLSTSWFSAGGDCASLASCTTIPWFKLTFSTPQTIGRIAMRGNREYESGYDFVRGKFEILNPAGVVLWSASYDLPGPDRDLDINLASPVVGAGAVKFTSEKDESNEPGFAEFQAFVP